MRAVGSGTTAEVYDGMLCSDGGSTSGPKMTPLFHDGPGGLSARPQIIVDLMQSGFPTGMVFKFNVSEFVALAQRGQDEAIEFLLTRKVARADALSLCPARSKTAENLCKASMVEQRV